MDEEAYVLFLSTSKNNLERRYILKSSKKIVICVLLILISIISIILINKNTNKTFKYKGSTIALTVDGNSATSFPASGKYNVTVNCNNAKGRWNPKTWKLEITKITGTVTCDVSFNSSVTNLTTQVNNEATRNENGKRYEGKNPNNYIWFNDELWRIIGNIPVCLTRGCASTENRVKIIRNDSIGAIKFDESSSTWMGSNIQNLLNTCYLGKASSCDSYCDVFSTSAKGTCDYSSDGIDVNDYYGKMVEDVYFNVGAGDETYKTAANYYTQEIATHATSTSKIGLMYASDWGYAIEGYTRVLGDSGRPWSSSDKNWLFSNGYEWTMSAHTSSYPLLATNSGYLFGGAYSCGFSIRPVLYLKSSVYVVSGTGTKVDPYRIGM